MKVNIADVSPVRKKIEVEIGAEKVSQEIEAFLRKLNKEVRIKGFRPGKVPLPILKSRYRDYLEEEVSLKLIDDSYHEILKEQDVKAVASPQIEREGLKEGEAFKYSALVDIRPEIEAQGYLGIKLTRRKAEVSQEMLEERLSALRDAHAKARPLEEERGLAQGDLAVIDLEGQGEGEIRFSRRDYAAVAGSASFPYAFWKEMEGARPQEERQFKVSYPSDYQNERLRGKDISFRVHLKEIKEIIRPALNDELAKQMGYETLEELKSKLSLALIQEAEKKAQEEVEEQAKGILMSANPFEVPASMVEEQAEARLEEIKESLRPGSREPNWDRLREELRAPVEREIRARLILEEIGKKEGLTISDSALDKEFGRMAGETSQSPEGVRNFFMKEGRLENLKRHLLINKALGLVIERADILEVE